VLKIGARHELKHIISYSDYLKLRAALRAALQYDNHVDANGEYLIRSLYFDTPNDKALREKIDGVNRREKFRIRRYGNDINFIRLEKKSKINDLCYKVSLPISAEEVWRLQHGDLSWMIDESRPLLLDLYCKMRNELLRPKTIVSYIREPFVYVPGNVRLTLDRDIRTGMYSTDFLSNERREIPAGENEILLEVKYDAFLPGIITDLVQLPNRMASSFSKYAACRMYG
jgi:hypothetical protein